jgi:hypothetical protein
MAIWHRIETMARSEGLADGVAARIADPLWTLARQWQIGELRGDDAARPIGVQVNLRSIDVAGLGAKGRPTAPLEPAVPLEAQVEPIGASDTGTAALHDRALAGRRLLRSLRSSGLTQAADALLAEYPLTRLAPTGLEPPGTLSATAQLLRSRGLDAAAILEAPPDDLSRLLGRLDAARASAAMGAIDHWRVWCSSRGLGVNGTFWDDERLEYSFHAEAADGSTRLDAPEHTGGRVDWYSFDVQVGNGTEDRSGRLEVPQLPRPGDRPIPTQTVQALPSPARYAGMPADRWWELEDGAVNLAEIEAGPADVARLIVAEFAVSYSNDWFVVPVRVPVGSLTDVVTVVVVDNFGGRAQVPSVATLDGDGKGPHRPWRMFEMSGDEVGLGHPSPWLSMPRVTQGDVTGEVVERVSLVRDEGANLAWAIEQLVEGPAGRPVDRASVGQRGAPAPNAGPRGRTAAPDWTYQLESSAPPPWWIPLLPERVAPDSAEIRFRRSRMQGWEDLPGQLAGPQGTVLDATRPRWIREEEVPRGGIRVERRWRSARDADGGVHVWLQLEKSTGRGERSSGIRWDVIDPAGSALARRVPPFVDRPSGAEP